MVQTHCYGKLLSEPKAQGLCADYSILFSSVADRPSSLLDEAIDSLLKIRRSPFILFRLGVFIENFLGMHNRNI